MEAKQIEVMQECARESLNGTMTFPVVVAKLAAAGVERYHADYSRNEVTYYLADGDSAVVETPHESAETANLFSPKAVEAAVRRSQRGEHTYRDFVRETKAAGCVGYFVQIAGRRAIYFGRRGECHVELFPPSA